MARTSYRHITGMICLALLVLAALAAPSARAADARMTQIETQLVAGNFLNEMLTDGAFDEYCTENLAVSVVQSGQGIIGARIARLAFAEIQQVAQATHAKVDSIVAGEGVASAEITLTGLAPDDYGNIASTGRVVRTSFSVFLTLEAGKVTALRIYGIDFLLTLEQPASAGTPYETLPAAGPH